MFCLFIYKNLDFYYMDKKDTEDNFIDWLNIPSDFSPESFEIVEMVDIEDFGSGIEEKNNINIVDCEQETNIDCKQETNIDCKQETNIDCKQETNIDCKQETENTQYELRPKYTKGTLTYSYVTDEVSHSTDIITDPQDAEDYKNRLLLYVEEKYHKLSDRIEQISEYIRNRTYMHRLKTIIVNLYVDINNFYNTNQEIILNITTLFALVGIVKLGHHRKVRDEYLLLKNHINMMKHYVINYLS